MATSTIPNVLAGLVGPIGVFTTAAGLAAVQVSYGTPRSIEKDAVVMPGGTVDWDQEWGAIAPTHPRNEHYTLDLRVNAASPGYTQQAAIERAFTLLAVLETLLRPVSPLATLAAGQHIRDLQLVLQALVTGRHGTEGYEAEIQAGVRVFARI